MSPSKWCIAILLYASLATGEIKNVGWWKNAVFYQVYPRSFMDSNNDGIGDLNGVTAKLDHFLDAGIKAIWLSPIYASPMVDFGYDISDFRDIDEAFGTMEDLENLTKEAKKRGIKVIMDLVPNHTSDKHYWFQQSVKGVGKYKDYYMWRPGKNATTPPNNWISVFSGPAWTFNETRNLWYFHQFEYRQPDLNYSNPNVRQEMEEVIKFWLGKGIDGFRVDAIPHVYERDDLPDEPRSNVANATERDYTYLNHIYTKDDPRTYDLIQSWRNILDDWARSRNEEEKVILTEAYTDLDNTTKYYRYGSHVPFNFDFIMKVSNKSSAADFKKVIDDWVQRTPVNGSANWVMGNHDRSRTATRYPGRADQMTMLEMVLPGIAVTYNGEEIAMEDKLDISWAATQDPQACNTDPETYQSRSRDPNRTPFQWDDSNENAGFNTGHTPWLPVHENYKTLNLKKQKSDQYSHYKIYKSLTTLRTNSLTLKNGTLKTEVLNDGNVLAIVRELSVEKIILLINFFDNQSTVVDISKYTNANTNATIYVSNIGSHDTLKWNATVVPKQVNLPAKASVVLINTKNTDNGVALLLVPIKLIFGMAFIALIVNRM